MQETGEDPVLALQPAQPGQSRRDTGHAPARQAGQGQLRHCGDWPLQLPVEVLLGGNGVTQGANCVDGHRAEKVQGAVFQQEGGTGGAQLGHI